jgi:hypothetical protein
MFDHISANEARGWFLPEAKIGWEPWAKGSLKNKFADTKCLGSSRKAQPLRYWRSGLG